MTAAENRRRVNRLRAEEAAGRKAEVQECKYGPEQRRQAQLNKQQMRAAGS